MTFVEAHRHTFGVAPLLAAIGEPVSTFYDRTSREPSLRAVADAVLAERIEAIWERSRRSYGAPRIHAMLAREGIRVGRKRVERLMRQLGIQGAHLHKHWKTTRQDRHATAAPDLVDRQFHAAEPNTLWVADLTYVKTLQGILYLAVVLDVFSRKVVGWQMADRMTTDLVLTAFEMGLWRRDIVRGRLIHHSDAGSQGGFKWSSQHPDHGGVLWRRGGTRVLRVGRCTGRCGRRGGRRLVGRSSGGSGRRSPRV
ncbi:MAG: OrfB [Thermomicrobiales bacterium]|nr:OrfB [Thermomicrobiales bacterium]